MAFQFFRQRPGVRVKCELLTQFSELWKADVGHASPGKSMLAGFVVSFSASGVFKRRDLMSVERAKAVLLIPFSPPERT